MVARTNEIWKLEKEKKHLRNKLQEIKREILLGKKQAGKTMWLAELQKILKS